MMARRTFLGFAGLLLAGCAMTDASAVAGVWSGVLASRGRLLRLRIEIAADGGVQVFSLDQGAKIPGHVKLTGDLISISMPLAAVTFEGKHTGQRIVGTWRQGPSAFPLTLMRGEAGLTEQAGAEQAALPLTSAVLEDLRSKAGAPAFAAACAKAGGETKTFISGVRMKGAAALVTAQDQWHLGSISKSFLATLVGRLVDAGKLSWSDTLGQVLGEAFPAMAPAYKSATFKHLLSHHAGLPRDLSLVEMTAIVAMHRDVPSQTRAVLERGFAAPPLAPLGAQMAYSNIGYIAAGAMIDAKCGRAWQDLMREHVFAPLGLASAGFHAPGRAGALDQPAGHGDVFGAPYRAYPPGDANGDLPDVMAPAGAIHMDLPDLLTFLAANRDRTDFLKPETWDALHTPPFGGTYALGWEVRHGGVLWHSGGNLRWYAEVEIDRAKGVIAAAVTNDGRTSVFPYISETLQRVAAAA